MKDFYKKILEEIDDISESKELETAVFTYGFIWGKKLFCKGAEADIS